MESSLTSNKKGGSKKAFSFGEPVQNTGSLEDTFFFFFAGSFKKCG